jgi:hypothetical protein
MLIEPLFSVVIGMTFPFTSERLVPATSKTRDAVPGEAPGAMLNKICPRPKVDAAGTVVPVPIAATSDESTNCPLGGGVTDMTGPKSEFPAKI